MTPALATICSEFGIEILPTKIRRRPMQTHAGDTIQELIDRYGIEHARLVMMTIVETRNHANALAKPILLAVSDVARSHKDWTDNATKWFETFDAIDLLDIWEQAKVGGKFTARGFIESILTIKLAEVFREQEALPL